MTADNAGTNQQEPSIDTLGPPTSTAAVNQQPTQALTGRAQLVDVRVAGQLTFDRVVFEFDGPLPGQRVEFVNEVTQDGSGDPVPLRGRAFLQVSMFPASAFDDNNSPTFPGPLPRPANLAALRDLKDAGDFEATL